MKAYAIHLITILILVTACGNNNSAQTNTDDEYEEGVATESGDKNDFSEAEPKLGLIQKVKKRN